MSDLATVQLLADALCAVWEEAPLRLGGDQPAKEEALAAVRAATGNAERLTWADHLAKGMVAVRHRDRDSLPTPWLVITQVRYRSDGSDPLGLVYVIAVDATTGAWRAIECPAVEPWFVKVGVRVI